MNFCNTLNLLLIAGAVSLAACNNSEQPKTETATTKEPKIKEENVTYEGDGVTMNGFVAYDENKEGPRPAVLVVHEWWGLNDYPKQRAKQLAELGYVAMAIDLFGNGKVAETPDSAGKYAMPFYGDPQMTKRRFDAALQKLKTYSQVDQSKVGAIGYCFGGSMVLNMAKMGEDLKGVVSFHGGLEGVPPNKDQTKAAILVLTGAADPMVPQAQVDKFKHQMDSAGIKYTLIPYPGAMHAFTNPKATEVGKKFNIPVAYNAAADSASWNEMKQFFGRIF